MTTPTTSPTVTFQLGDIAVHPAHGPGRVDGIEEREHGGKRATFYVLRILQTSAKVMVSVESAHAVGLRPVMSQDEALAVLQTLRAQEVAVSAQPWTRRQRIYSDMLKGGIPREIAAVLRDMFRLRSGKTLSLAERRLLDHAKGMLVHELALARNLHCSAIEQEVDAILCEASKPAA